MKNKKNNNNKITLFAIFAIILTIIALIATSGTYAKYTSSKDTTTARARVAKWSVLINGNDMTDQTETVTFNLFDEIYDTDEEGGDSTLLESNVTQASTTSSTKIIAPGVSGKFSFEIENASEVDIKYSLEFDEENEITVQDSEGNDQTVYIPILYSISKTGTYYDAEGLTSYLQSNAQTIAQGGTQTVTIYWKWDYEADSTNRYQQTNAKDTALGIAAQDFGSEPTYEVTATIVATQVN